MNPITTFLPKFQGGCVCVQTPGPPLWIRACDLDLHWSKVNHSCERNFMGLNLMQFNTLPHKPDF